MIKKFTLYLGLNDKETKMQKIATVEAFKIVTISLPNVSVAELSSRLRESTSTITERL